MGFQIKVRCQGLKKCIHSVPFCKKRWDFTTSDSFLNFWVFPLLGFLNPKAGFLIFEEIIHWFLKKNTIFCCYLVLLFITYFSKKQDILLDTCTYEVLFLNKH